MAQASFSTGSRSQVNCRAKLTHAAPAHPCARGIPFILNIKGPAVTPAQISHYWEGAIYLAALAAGFLAAGFLAAALRGLAGGLDIAVTLRDKV